MTAIVAVEGPSSVWLGGDAAATWPDHSRQTLTSEKVWRHGEWAFGSCGSLRLLQLLRHVLVVPQAPDSVDDLDRFIVTDFIDAVRATLLDAGVTQSKDGVETMDESDFVVALRGRVYTVQGDFSVVRSSLGYAATGSGIDLALGSLYSTQSLSPRTRIRKALEAAAMHNASVAPPFTILELETN